MSVTRCQIYCRTSSDEGLAQEFNSLHAQEEACEAYIKSQQSLSWRNTGSSIQDGGFSGGNLSRPGLDELIAAIKKRRIDCVVVYKVDRLTRSLADFAKLVELFDEYGVSFVSVTQQFNTTSSMGRLTLNVLLSFAQFEREVTAERIRDKVAASKKKGIWMGGQPPLGYKPVDRELTIVPEQAEVVRLIFDRFQTEKSVPALAKSLRVDGVRSPERELGSGNKIGGKEFSKGALYTILRNPIYVGTIRHKGTLHKGRHKPIISQTLFDQTALKLNQNVQRNSTSNAKRAAKDLRGKLVDEAGEPMLIKTTYKAEKRYRYYVSQDDHELNQRVSADKIETSCLDAMKSFAQKPSGLQAALIDRGLDLSELQVQQVAKRLATFDAIEQVRTTTTGKAKITLAGFVLDGITGNQPTPLEVDFEFEPAAKSSMARPKAITTSSGNPSQPTSYIAHVQAAFTYWEHWEKNPKLSLAKLAQHFDLQRSRMSNLIRLRFLSPKVLKAIMSGTILRLGSEELIRKGFPTDWQSQEAALLP